MAMREANPCVCRVLGEVKCQAGNRANMPIPEIGASWDPVELVLAVAMLL